MDTPTRILLEQIGLLGYRVSVAVDHVEAVSEKTGERLIVYGDDLDVMADALLTMVRLDLEEDDMKSAAGPDDHTGPDKVADAGSEGGATP